jgi:AcrR family transcriptional regulator
MHARIPRAIPRDPVTAEDRARSLAALRTLLREDHGIGAFTLDAIAARAGVARAVMQRQFGNLAGLCEALWDELFSDGCLGQLPRALTLADPFDALAELIAIHARFWHAERRVIRRLRALAALDRDLERTLRQRQEEHKLALRKLASRLPSRALTAASGYAALDVLAIATSFEAYDAIAGSEHDPDEATAALQELARAAIAGDRK